MPDRWTPEETSHVHEMVETKAEMEAVQRAIWHKGRGRYDRPAFLPGWDEEPVFDGSFTHDGPVNPVRRLTQEEYDSMTDHDENVMYYIIPPDDDGITRETFHFTEF